mgnify:CR=1 FL=1
MATGTSRGLVVGTTGTKANGGSYFVATLAFGP